MEDNIDLNESLDEMLRSKEVVSVVAGGKVLGLGRSSAYDAARRGDLPTIRIGRRLVVPLRQLRNLLEHGGRVA